MPPCFAISPRTERRPGGSTMAHPAGDIPRTCILNLPPTPLQIQSIPSILSKQTPQPRDQPGLPGARPRHASRYRHALNDDLAGQHQPGPPTPLPLVTLTFIPSSRPAPPCPPPRRPDALPPPCPAVPPTTERRPAGSTMAHPAGDIPMTWALHLLHTPLQSCPSP